MSADSTPLLTPAQRKLVGFALSFAALCTIGWLLFALLSGVASFISAFAGVIWPLAVAGILALLMRPIVTFFERRLKLSRPVAVVLLYAVFTRPHSEWLLGSGSVVPPSALIVADVALAAITIATVGAGVVICWRAFWERVKRSFIGFSLRPLEPFLFLRGKHQGLMLGQALAVDVDARPQYRLANLVMQRRARWLLARTDELIAE